MRRSIATVSLDGNLRKKIEAIAAAHFNAVEIFEIDFLRLDGFASWIRSIVDDLGNIYEASAELRKRRIPLLTTPRNYYDDLLARFDLEPAQVEELRRHNLLYACTQL